MLRIQWLGRAVCAAVVCVSLASAASAEDVNFPDANLEAKVRLDLGIPEPTPITDVNMATMTSFYADDLDISNIQGLEYGTNLTMLYMPENQFSDIFAVSGLTNLSSLYLHSNQISDIFAVSGLANLTSMNLDNNHISDITAVSGLTNLTWLRLQDNQIIDISAMTSLTNLTFVKLSGNQISDISAMSGLTSLRSVYMSCNQISDISTMSGLTNLSSLGLNGNQISDISVVGGMTNLYKLYLGWNEISDISVIAGLANMAKLELDNNQISDITAIAGLTNLTRLYLNGNQIETMNISNSDFSSLGDFKIGDNPLTSVLLVDATLSQTVFDVLMDGGSSGPGTGIAGISGVLSLDMSGVDFTGISDFSKMYTMDDLETLLLAGASNLAGSEVVSLTGELDSLNLLDVTGLWDSFDMASQGSLNAWDAVSGNTLIIPEPATLSLLALGGLALLRQRRKA